MDGNEETNKALRRLDRTCRRIETFLAECFRCVSEGERLAGMALLSVAGGALGLSMAILRNFKGPPVGRSLYCLVAAWILLGICVVAQLISLSLIPRDYTERGHWAWTVLDKAHDMSEPVPEPDMTSWHRRAKAFRISLATCILGIVAFAVFLLLNVASTQA